MRIANKSNFVRKSKKSDKKNLWLKLAIGVGLIILTFYLGLKFFIFVLSSASKYFVADTETTISPQAEIKPEILINSVDLASATNSAKIKAVLRAENADAAEVYLNDEKVDELKLSDITTAEFIIYGLTEGENSVYFVLKSGKEEKKSKIYSIVYDSKQPEIELEDLPNSTVLDFVVIKGKLSEKSDLFINSQPIVVLPDLSFEHRYFLTEGENKIIIRAVDSAGNSATAEVSILKEQP